MKPAIVVVGYNRPCSLKRLLDSIGNSYYPDEAITLIISLDKASNENEVLEVAKSFCWNHGKKIIRTFEERQGLRKHIIQCGDYSNEYGSVIILEDDLIVSPNYYNYVVKALDYYEKSPKVTGIALYSHEWNGFINKNFSPVIDRYDTYLGQFSITWGQVWTDKWWNGFKAFYIENEGKLKSSHKIPEQVTSWSNQSWGKYFVYYIVERDLYYVIPRQALSTNCAEVGQHNKSANNYFQVKLLYDRKDNYLFSPEDKAIKYDIFCENMNLDKYFSEEIQREGITIDLYGYGKSIDEHRYLLSTKLLPYKVVASYGIQMRPIEMNIYYNIAGQEIFLYDTANRSRQPKNNEYNIVQYEIRGIRVVPLLKYGFRVLFYTIKNRLKK